MQVTRHPRLFARLAVVLSACALFPAHAADSPRPYTVGVVPQFEARKLAEIWQPILDEAGKRAGVALTLKPATNIPAFEKQFAEGAYDFVYLNPYHLIVANQKQGYLPMVRDTAIPLRGILVVRKDSPLRSVKDLNGKQVAFPAPNALGAALIPRAEFRHKFGIRVKELYAENHSSVYLNVVLGVADAGGGVERTLAEQPDNIRTQLRVLYRTDDFPPHPIAVHPRVPHGVRDKVRTALLALGNDNAGKALLASVPIERIGPASLSEYEGLRRLRLSEFYAD